MRVARGGAPDTEVFIMEHLRNFLGQCEARVSQRANQHSQEVVAIRQNVDNTLVLVQRWLTNNTQLHKISTKGVIGYIPSRSVREAKIQELQKAKQTDWGYLNGQLAKVMEGLHRGRAAKREKQPPKPSEFAPLAHKLLTQWGTQSQNTDDPTAFMGGRIIQRFDRLVQEVQKIDSSDPRYPLQKQYEDQLKVYFKLQQAVIKFEQGGQDSADVKGQLGTDKQLTNFVQQMMELEKQWDGWKRPREISQRKAKKLPPTPGIKEKGRAIADVLSRKHSNKEILPDILQGWEQDGSLHKSWVEEIKAIIDAFKAPLKQPGLTQATVDGWIEKNLYQKWFNRYGQRPDIIRPSSLFSTQFLSRGKKNPKGVLLKK